MDKALFVFNSDDSVGDVEMIKTPYGIDVFVDGKMICFIDLFYNDKEKFEIFSHMFPDVDTDTDGETGQFVAEYFGHDEYDGATRIIVYKKGQK